MASLNSFQASLLRDLDRTLNTCAQDAVKTSEILQDSPVVFRRTLGRAILIDATDMRLFIAPGIFLKELSWSRGIAFRDLLTFPQFFEEPRRDIIILLLGKRPIHKQKLRATNDAPHLNDL